MLTPLTLDQLKIHFEQKLEFTLKESDCPAPLLKQAMEYSALSAGKRLRPLLVYCTGLTFGAKLETLDPLAIAVELIHAYSLIHDDLPALDNDDLRRGIPTCHKQFNEATAILAGDGLQTLAFEIISNPQKEITPMQQLHMLHVLAQAIGVSGMVGGQALEFEKENSSAADLLDIHSHKTGKLILASAQLGFLASPENKNKNYQSTIDEFGHAFGLTFQIQDDLLDIDQDNDVTADHNIFHLLGESAAQALFNEYQQKIYGALTKIPLDTSLLIQLCEKVFKGQEK